MTKAPKRRYAVVLIAAAVALFALGYAITATTQKAQTEQQRADAAYHTAKQLCDQLEDAGYHCVEDPESLRGDEGPIGPAGRGILDAKCIAGRWSVTYTDGTTDANAGPCTGDRGPSGEDGSSGKDGEDGKDGDKGEPGKDGAQGPPGPPGKDGKDGTNGKDGRSITDATCNPDTGRWEITYSDGSTDSDAGPCTVL